GRRGLRTAAAPRVFRRCPCVRRRYYRPGVHPPSVPAGRVLASPDCTSGANRPGPPAGATARIASAVTTGPVRGGIGGRADRRGGRVEPRRRQLTSFLAIRPDT